MDSQLIVEEASTERPLNCSSADDQEAAAAAAVLAPEESTPGGDQDQVTSTKRGRRKRVVKTEGGGEEDKKKMVSSLDRPSRERKSVERYAAMSPRVLATKVLEIQQGSGEKLKDIPNVVFKLSKRKSDDNLRVLHNILFGRKANVHFLKRNILQFSGFVWSQDEEKYRLKLKEKLNKFNKDRLLDLSDLLDIYTLKGNTKKEDISARLMEFLESPHVTREVILAEKVMKGKKRKRGVKRTGERGLDESSADKEKKSEKKRRREPSKDDKEDEGKADSIDRDDESADEDESADAGETSESSKSDAEDGENEHKSEKEMDEHEELESKHHSPVVREVSRATSKKDPSSSKKKVDNEIKSKVSSESKDTKRSSKKGLSSSKKKVVTEGEPKVNSESKAGISKDTKESLNMSVTSKKGMSPSKKKVDTEGEPKVPSESKAESPKDTKGKSLSSKRKVSTEGDIPKKVDKKKEKRNVGTAIKDLTESKEGAKMESNDAEKRQGKRTNVSVTPSTEELSAAVSKILKEVDFNVATLADIIRQLGARFDSDLMDRKAEIKRILEEVINNMTDDEDAGDDNGDEEGKNT